jgi:hypothetical protein
MPVPIQPIDLLAPGFLGLNTNREVSAPEGFALVADNCVIDGSGRLAAREGFMTQQAPTAGSPRITAIHEYLSGNPPEIIYSDINGAIASGVTGVVTNISHPTLGSPFWKFCNFNNNVIGFHDGRNPIIYNGVGAFADVPITFPASGTSTFSGIGLAAFGRLWTTDATKTVVKYSDLLIPGSWTDDNGSGGDAGGSAGVLDLKTVWAYGVDKVVAIQEFNDFLLILGEKSIVVYSGAEEPNTMQINDIVGGVGCLARDSVVDIGTDVLFLSQGGVKSLRQALLEKNMPLSEVSSNVRSELIAAARGITPSLIQAEYHEPSGFYLLSLGEVTYIFDTRARLEDGTFRVTKWLSIEPTAFASAVDGALHLGRPGLVAQYGGFTDGGDSYDLSYKSLWNTLGTPRNKIAKKAVLSTTGGQGYVVDVCLAYDYMQNERCSQIVLDSGVSGGAEWGVAEWGVAEWSGSIAENRISTSVAGSGNAVQIGLKTTVRGDSIAFSRIELHTKAGRLG